MSEFRRHLMMGDGDKTDIFKSAYFYVPFKDKQTVVDINNSIGPTASTGNLTNDGYYTSGDYEYLEYSDVNLLNSLNNTFTIYIKLIPYELTRNQYLFDIAQRQSNGHPKLLSLFIYKTKDNKFGFTLNRKMDDVYMDDSIYNSPVVQYQDLYNICINYNRNTGELNCFINGIKSTYTNYYSQIIANVVTIARNAGNTTRFAKATYQSFAIWDRILTDDECIQLTS